MTNAPSVLASRASVAALVACVFVVDIALFPDLTLSVLYALPLVVAAERLTPRDTLVATGGACLAYTAAVALQAVTPSAAVLRGCVLVVIGGLCWLLAVRLDQTKRAQREAETARAELQGFLAMVAHDLRAPLTTVSMTSQLLTMDDSTAAARKIAVGLLRPEVGRMERLVADLADAAKIGAGTFELHPRPTDYADVVRSVVEAQRLAAPERRIELRAPDRLEAIGDPDRLAQVATNLVNNAVKYSRVDDPVRVDVCRAGDHVEIRVHDQGPGIAPADLDRLFKPFSRLATGARKPGLGLGLYIVDAIVRGHGGRVWASSAGAGHGTTFTVELPVAPGPRSHGSLTALERA